MVHICSDISEQSDETSSYIIITTYACLSRPTVVCRRSSYSIFTTNSRYRYGDGRKITEIWFWLSRRGGEFRSCAIISIASGSKLEKAGWSWLVLIGILVLFGEPVKDKSHAALTDYIIINAVRSACIVEIVTTILQSLLRATITTGIYLSGNEMSQCPSPRSVRPIQCGSRRMKENDLICSHCTAKTSNLPILYIYLWRNTPSPSLEQLLQMFDVTSQTISVLEIYGSWTHLQLLLNSAANNVALRQWTHRDFWRQHS